MNDKLSNNGNDKGNEEEIDWSDYEIVSKGKESYPSYGLKVFFLRWQAVFFGGRPG